MQRKPETKRIVPDYPKELDVYVNRSMREFKAYKRYYSHWEKLGLPHPRPISYILLPADFRK